MLHKTKLMSMILVAITALLLTTSATPAQAAPFVERINWIQIDRIETERSNCAFDLEEFELPFVIYASSEITWTTFDDDDDLPPFGDGITITLYDISGRVLQYHGRPWREDISDPTFEQGGGTAISDLVFRYSFSTMPYTPVRPWQMIAHDDYGQGEELGSLIFDPADYGACENLPYIGIQTGIDSDPIADTSAQNTAIYNSQDDDGNPSLDVYGIDDEGEGYYAFTITEADLAPFADNPPEENTEIMTVGNVALYVLTTGEYQLNIGPDEEGKVRVVIFNGLPPTNVYSYDYNVYDILDGE